MKSCLGHENSGTGFPTPATRRVLDHEYTMTVGFLILFLVMDSPYASQLSTSEARFRTDPPRVIEDQFFPEPLYPLEDYRKKLLSRSSPLEVVQIRAWPSDLTVSARVGVIRVRRSLLTYVTDRDASGNYRLRLDLTADGDLTNDPWRPLKRRGDQLFGPDAAFGTMINEILNGTPVVFALTVLPERQLVLRQAITQREGTVALGGREFPFALIGQFGAYSTLYLDTNGDGNLSIGAAYSDEKFSNLSPYVTLGDKTYEWSSDEHGEYLSLKLHDRKLPERLRLDPGSIAPDFSFFDIDGHAGTLADYQGQVVLLYFWGAWCDPCRPATQELLGVYDRLRASGFEIIGINSKDALDTIRSYISDLGVPWPQIAQGDDGPILELYRVDRYPSFVLIDENGAIVARGIRELEAKITALVSTGTCPAE